MSHEPNALASAASAYLRSAINQPVRWHEWSPAAFALAVEQNKPILLDIGAVWCHWCHVMDRESYENDQTAAVINEHYIAIKVDRDERPDVDARYQAAVSAISGQGGWPLTAFLTPDGRPFFGGTYFPRQDQFGRPGFQRVLLTMASAFQQKRDEVDDSAASVMAAIEHNETFSGRSSRITAELATKLTSAITGMYDQRYGGFGSQPKFPHSTAIDLLLDSALRPGADEKISASALGTLSAMSRGGIYDHLAGGFHRYSVDEQWIVPHFEKMLYDNAGLLANYAHAFQSFAEPEAARVARETILWVDTWLSDRERGGFYASQDADINLDDDGDYFTWTLDEARSVLTAEELNVAAPFYDIGDVGDMHHNPAKNVLHVKHLLGQVAQRAGMPPEQATSLLRSAKQKLYAARLQRPTPYIDRTIYTGWNGMMISAYIAAGRALAIPAVTAFALKSLDRILADAWNPEVGLSHVVAYADGTSARKHVPSTVDDYAFLATCCLDAWECSGNLKYYLAAKSLAEYVAANFWDPTGLGFFDTPLTDEPALGALSARRKPLQDAPAPAANPTMASLLVRLEELSGKQEYRDMAFDTLEIFGGVVEHFGLYAASYGLALQRLVQPAAQVVILGDDEAAKMLEAAALTRYSVSKSVIRLSYTQLSALPETLAETIPNLPGIESGKSVAIVCAAKTCHPPVADPESLLQLLNRALVHFS
ncbi:thioredoxin domain-containing protein [Terriglobus sp. 2YAB30_2]|uniref:thioredoxin domain-containing protein n=1 Tax=unclassified Terriglobus TaxID=2628988 RepID=UPI003F95F27B